MNIIKAITFLLCSTLLVGQTTPIRNPQIQGASGSIVSGATLTNSGTISGAGTFNFGSGAVTLPATQILTNVTLNGTITFADNIKQTFNPGATYVGINVGSYAGVPSTLANGDIWYDSTANALKARINGATVSLGAGGGGSSTLDTLTDVNLTSLADVDFLRYDSGTSKWINRTPANVRTDLSLGAAALLGTSTGGNGTADNGKVLIFDTGGHFHATTSISVNNTSGTITAQFRPDSLLLNSTGSGSHTINGSATGARSHTLLDESGTLAHTATTLAGYGITDAQPLDTTLTALAALNNTKGVLAQTGSDTFTRLQTPVNVKVYGATGDARKFTDGVTVNGTNTITSATGDFTSADVGKVIWGTISAGTNVVTPRTVATVVSSTELTVSGATLGASTGVTIVIGTDDTAAIQAAVTAAEAMPSRGAIYLPGGGYITTDTPFVFTATAVGGALPSIVGDGSATVTIFPSPTSTLHLSDYIFNYDAIAGRKHMAGFTVDGTYGTFSSDIVMFFSSSSNHNTLRDVWVKDFTSLFAGVSVSSSDTVFQNCHIEGMLGGRGIYCNGALTFIDSYAGNCGYFAIDVANGAINVVRGTLDESTAGTVQLQNSTGTFDGGTVYAGASYTALSADATSVVRAVGTRFVPFSSNNNCTGISVASGGTARLANCTLTGSGTGYGLNNSGTVYDVGGNTFTTTTGTAPVDALSSVVSVAHGGTGASSLANLIALTTDTTGNYVADVAGTANEITSTHTPGEGSTATLSLPAAIDLGGKTSFEIPNGAAPTVDAFGEIAGDNDLWAASRGAPLFFDGTAATALVNVLVSDTPSNGQVPKWNTGGTITWEADNSGGTISGTDTQVMFFDGTDTPAGDAGMTYNKTTNVLTAAGFVGALTGNASTVTTNANMTGDVTSSGSNATTIAAMTAPGPLLAENASIRLDPAGSADGKYTGTTVTGTAGAALAFGDVVVLDVTDSRWELADANAAAAADGDARALLGICVLAAAADGDPTTILLHGIVRADTAFPALTVGAPVYVGETAGDAVVTQPTTADVLIRVIGHALTADEMFFSPDNTWITHL